MRHPFWIINSILFLLLLITLLFISFSQISIPERESIEPVLYSTLKREKRLQINISKIYEADLFGSYQAAIEAPEKAEAVFPQPPEPQAIEVPELPKPQFLDPLDVTLRGIFIVSNDGSKNRIIIADNKTKKEALYKTGDKIIDAQVIRIFSNKIVLLRSNGQQEVLYLREQDARLDTDYAMIEEWNLVIKQIGSTSFLVDPVAFARRIQDLGQLIEMLHLITAYKQGVSIGCRVGRLDEKSVGIALGLQPGDIITSIDNIAADTTANRLKIYQALLTKKKEDLIVVQLLRNKAEMSLEYRLKEMIAEEVQKETPHNKFLIQKLEEEEKRKILQHKYEFAPTLQDIRNREKQTMIERGSAPQPQE